MRISDWSSDVCSSDLFDKARDKIMMGTENRSMAMSEEEKTLTAYHEAGHAIVGRLVPEHDPVYKVTIIPRGRALGITMYRSEERRVGKECVSPCRSRWSPYH